MRTAILITIYIIINVYTAAQTGYWLRRCFNKNSEKSYSKLFYILYIILALPPVLGAYLPDCPVKFEMAAVGNIWLGFYMYFTGFLLIAQLIRFIIKLVSRSKHKEKSVIAARIILSLMLLMTLSLNIYGVLNAQDIHTTKYSVTINKYAGTTKHLKIALIADFHLGCNSDLAMYKELTAKINAMHPDLVIVDGDIFNSTYSALKTPGKYSDVLSGIKSKYGVYAVYGNHDVDESLFGGFAVTNSSHSFRNPKVTQFMKNSGFNILDDTVTTIANGKIVLAGRKDGEKSGNGTDKRENMKSLLSGVDKSRPVLVIEHEPVDFENISSAGADFVLSGHTHDGQIFPGNILTKFINENSYGLKTIAGVKSLVTSGVGYYGPPIRIGTISEIAEIDLSFK